MWELASFNCRDEKFIAISLEEDVFGPLLVNKLRQSAVFYRSHSRLSWFRFSATYPVLSPKAIGTWYQSIIFSKLLWQDVE